MCYLAELLLPWSPHRSKQTWNHHLYYGCTSCSLSYRLPELLHLPQPCPPHWGSPALPLLLPRSLSPALCLTSGHTAGQLSSGMWDRSGGSIECDANSPVSASDFILLPWFLPAFGSFSSVQAVLFTLKLEKSFFLFGWVLMGFREVIYEYKFQPTHSS